MSFTSFLKGISSQKSTPFVHEFFIVLDIGTEFVKTALCHNVGKKNIEIIGYSRTPQHSTAMEGAMIINIEDVVSVCDIGIVDAIRKAERQMKEKAINVTGVVMGISGELVKGVSIVADYEREDPEAPISDDELVNVVENIKSQVFEDLKGDIADSIGTSPSKLKEVSTHINATYIDNHKVDDPKGFTGEEVSYRVYTTFAPALHINSMYEIAKRLGFEVIGIEVQPYAISRTYKGAKKADFSSVFIDIGGGTTDVAVVKEGGILGTKMIGFGGRVFTRRVAKELNVELHKAEEMKIDYSHKKLDATTEAKIKSSLASDGKLWAEGVEIALSEFEELEVVPSEFLLSGGGSELPETKDSLVAHPWLQVLNFARFPKIRHIYPKQIEGVIDKTGEMIYTVDVAPAALASISRTLL